MKRQVKCKYCMKIFRTECKHSRVCEECKFNNYLKRFKKKMTKEDFLKLNGLD